MHPRLTAALLAGATAHAAADTGVFYPINPSTTFQHTCEDPAGLPLMIDLDAEGYAPGDVIRIEAVGDFAYVPGGPEEGTGAIAVFSSDGVVDPDRSLVDRVPGAIQSDAPDFPTGAPNRCPGETTEIPEDFVCDGVEVTVPDRGDGRAAFLIVSAFDEFYSDNNDPDSDFKLRVELGASSIQNTKSLSFNSDYVVIPHGDGLNLGTQNTVEAWIKMSTQPTRDAAIIEKYCQDGSSEPPYNWLLRGSRDRRSVRGGVYNGSGGSDYSVFGPTAIDDNLWHHAAIVRDGQELRLYIDGVLDAVMEGVAVGGDSLSEIRLGMRCPARADTRYIGLLDEVRLWSVARSAAEISGSFRRVIDAATPGLVAYYRFEETGQTVCDSGVNSHHGTLGQSPAADSRDPARVDDAPSFEPCPADFAAPFGLLDLADVTAFASAFSAMDPIADLNPDGLFDLSDVNLFVMSFLAGCP